MYSVFLFVCKSLRFFRYMYTHEQYVELGAATSTARVLSEYPAAEVFEAFFCPLSWRF